jgi:hypothetical protein
LSSLLYGFIYEEPHGGIVEAGKEKEFRLQHDTGFSFPLRKCVLARNPAFAGTGGTANDESDISPYTTYFDAYGQLYR